MRTKGYDITAEILMTWQTQFNSGSLKKHEWFNELLSGRLLEGLSTAGVEATHHKPHGVAQDH